MTAAKSELAFTRYWQNLNTVGNLMVENSLQDFDANEMYLHPKNRLVLFKSVEKCSAFIILIFHTMPFQIVPVRVPFSKSPIFKIWRQKMCHFHVNRRPFRHIFHCFQNLLASCECCLNLLLLLRYTSLYRIIIFCLR